MSSNDYHIQVSLKTAAGTLINLPCDGEAQVVAALEIVRNVTQDIIATERLLSGATAAAPLIVSGDAEAVQPPQSNVVPFTPPAAAPTGPQCPHGTMTWRTGVSKKTGKPWGAHFCPTPQGTAGQCDARWDANYGK